MRIEVPLLACESTPPKGNWEGLVQILGSIVIPIIIGYVTYLIARKQITSTGVTQFRQQWIDDLRTSISEFVAKVEYLTLEIKGNNRNDQGIVDLFQDLVKLRYKIDLMLNPKEDDHRQIVTKLVKLRSDIYDNAVSVANIQSEISSLITLTKNVLKREWNVVKKGK